MRPYHQAPDCDFYVGDVRWVAESLPAQSVQCVVTSPPYWGLRDYGIASSIWGDVNDCSHEWNESTQRGEKSGGNWAQGTNGRGELQPGGVAVKRQAESTQVTTAACSWCGNWRGVLGLEPLHDCLGWARGETCSQCYICHMRTVARALWRVLRDDGCFFVNIGDSYAGSGKRPTGFNGIGDQEKRQGFVGSLGVKMGSVHGDSGHTSGVRPPVGLKPKDRVGIPERLALALQADGWTWRDTIHLCKVAPMPESVRDRTTQAHEPLFLFTKKARYYWDQSAVREPQTEWTASGSLTKFNPDEKLISQNAHRGQRLPEMNPLGRNPRSWMLWNPEPSGLQHYAAYPRFIPSFAIRAGCPADGIVFDPFSGSGTTQVVARELGRRSIYCDLSEKYAAIAIKRLEETTPMLPLPTAPRASAVQSKFGERE